MIAEIVSISSAAYSRAEMLPPLRAPTRVLRIPTQGKSDIVLRERRLRRARGTQILQFGDLQLPIETIHLREAVSQVRQPLMASPADMRRSSQRLEFLQGASSASSSAGLNSALTRASCSAMRALTLRREALAGGREVQLLAAAIDGRALADHQAALFEAVGDRHHGGAIHAERGGHRDLRNAGIRTGSATTSRSASG